MNTTSRQRALNAVARGHVTNRFDSGGNVFIVPEGISPRTCRELQNERLIEDAPGQRGTRFFKQQLTAAGQALRNKRKESGSF